MNETYQLLKQAKEIISTAQREGNAMVACPARLLVELVEHIEAGHD